MEIVAAFEDAAVVDGTGTAEITVVVDVAVEFVALALGAYPDHSILHSPVRSSRVPTV